MPRYVATSVEPQSALYAGWLRSQCSSNRRKLRSTHAMRWHVVLIGDNARLSHPPGWYGVLFTRYAQVLGAIEFLETVGGTHEEYLRWKRKAK